MPLHQFSHDVEDIWLDPLDISMMSRVKPKPKSMIIDPSASSAPTLTVVVTKSGKHCTVKETPAEIAEIVKQYQGA